MHIVVTYVDHSKPIDISHTVNQFLIISQCLYEITVVHVRVCMRFTGKSTWPLGVWDWSEVELDTHLCSLVVSERVIFARGD